jgi:hypothetical protein
LLGNPLQQHGALAAAGASVVDEVFARLHRLRM